ncbi:MFS transporter [Actinocrinis puniceicyclus]|uniref:MFS transporter n=1 Tax=Actinocrinis puniceicyclus TaxID=977794 RepID=A0A8J7WQ13_9ACTN|nr:MFS transporter [Actinocrinis puniceicyclus]MBS2963409.1 MFS transporter [Actinocrinis puniceicyclus]
MTYPMLSGAVRRALLALAVGGFAIGTGEFVVMGLLPQVASDLSVSIPRAGELISAYALGVVVGAPLLTAATVRYRRKPVLLVLMGWFALGNVLSALAPSFGLVLLARFATGLPHGAFFGAGAVVAGSLVERTRSNSAMAVMFAGLTVANIVGVPLTTILGQHAGWRLVYAIVGLIAGLAVLAVALAVPADAAVRPQHPDVVPGTRPSLRGELRAFAKPEVWLVLGVAMIGGGGLFATFSYITPMMTGITHYADSSMTWLLALFGLGMTVGNLVGAQLSDRFPARTLLFSLGAQIAVSIAFLAADHNRVTAAAAIFLFPLCSLAGLPTLQGRIIALAGGAPNLAAASIQAAFNIANSLGAYLGGLAIAAGFGFGSPNAVAALLAVAGLALAVAAVRVERGGGAVVPAAPRSEAPSSEIGSLPPGFEHERIGA